MPRSRVLTTLVVGSIALWFAWQRLPRSERAYLSNILRQIPDMPGRYAV